MSLRPLQLNSLIPVTRPHDTDFRFIIWNFLIIVQRGIENGGYVMFVHNYKCIFEYSEVNIAAVDDSRGSRTKLYVCGFLFICLTTENTIFITQVDQRHETGVVPQKDALDPVDLNLPVKPVISLFGRFLKYEVSTTSDTPCTAEGVSLNAFDVLMESACQIYLQQNETATDTGTLQLVTKRNRWHKLYNDIIKYLTSQRLSFNPLRPN